MTPELLVRTLQDFLAGARDAVVLDEGAVVFDLAQARYSISGEHNKCLLHLWSNERNVVRRVLDLEVSNEVLRLAVQRLGQTRPSKLEICRERDRRPPSARRATRLTYQRNLQLLLERKFSLFTASRLSSSPDLERSFGPIYSRGLLRRGQAAFAVLGVNGQETQASIDAALTFGILWLDVCGEAYGGRAFLQGLKLFLPRGRSTLVRERMAHLNPGAARWELYEFDEPGGSVQQLDVSDRGNVRTRLVHRVDEDAAQQRFAVAIRQVRQLMPEVEVAVLSPVAIAFRHHGLEFACARLQHQPGSLQSLPQLVFGMGAEERVLDLNNAVSFLELVRSVGEARHPDGPRDHPFWRMHPERWMESMVVRNLAEIDERLDAGSFYSQVPAFSASDRAMIDVLTVTRAGRLAVVELKADEDVHLPLQGLDYWARVQWHHSRGEFQQFGYFYGRELSAHSPLLFLAAPALHIHPATDILLRYMSPEIEWTIVGMDERWRDRIRAVFRKRSGQLQAQRQEERDKSESLPAAS